MKEEYSLEDAMYIWESIIIPRANEYLAMKAVQKQQQRRGKV